MSHLQATIGGFDSSNGNVELWLIFMNVDYYSFSEIKKFTFFEIRFSHTDYLEKNAAK